MSSVRCQAPASRHRVIHMPFRMELWQLHIGLYTRVITRRDPLRIGMHNHLTTSTNHVPGSLACALCTPITVSVRLAATSFCVSCDSGRDCQDCVGRRALHVPLSQPRRAACPGASDDQSGVCPKATGQVKVACSFLETRHVKAVG